MPNWAYNTLTIKHKDAKVLEKIAEELKGETEGQYLDFNKVIPMPETLDVAAPLRRDDLMFYILTLAKNRAEILELPHEILMFVYPILDEHKTDESLRELFQAYMQDYTKLVIAGTADEKDEWGIIKGISLLQGYRYFMNLSRYGINSWYDWCCSMWNTKWNANCGRGMMRTNDTLIYRFNTAWDAPWPIAAAISALYKNTIVTLETTYEDPDGMNSVSYYEGKPTLAAKYSQVYRYNKTDYETYRDAEKAAMKDGLNEDDAWDSIESGVDDKPNYQDTERWEINPEIINYAKEAKECA